MKRVRYVGVRDPRETNPERVRELLAAGAITKADLWQFNTQRLGGPLPGGGFGPVTAVIPGVTSRTLGPREGLSRRVRWGPAPESFVQEISNADWEAIQRLPEAAHWELVEDGPSVGAAKATPETPAVEGT